MISLPRPLRLIALLSILTLASCGPAAASSGPSQSLRPSGVTVVPAEAPQLAAEGQAADTRGIGDPNAPITVVEYSDFQCPFCATFASETRPRIEEQYVKTGKVYFVYRDLPLFDKHPGAILASHAARCAADQSAFWPMHDRIFRGMQAGEWGAGGATDFELFLGYAREIGLDAGALRTCVAENRHADAIELDYREALERGVNSTPTFFINGQPLMGAQPFEVFQQVFDRILSQTR